MIEKISTHILDFLDNESKLSEEEKDYYRYGIEITLSSVLSLCIVLIIGVVFHSVLDSLLFLLLFVPLRQYTGGFHAESYFFCNLSLAVIFSGLMLICNINAVLTYTYFWIIIATASLVIVIVFSPADNKNKPIKAEKIKYYKLKASFLAFVYGASGIMLIGIQNHLGLMVIMSLSVIAILQVVGVCKRFVKG